MRTEIEKYEKIEQYLKGELSEKERFLFEAQIESDPGLALEVQNHQKMQDFIFEKSMVDVRGQIRNIHIRNQVKPWRRINRGGMFSILGIITITGSIMISVFINKSKPSEGVPVMDVQTGTVTEEANGIVPEEKERNAEPVVTVGSPLEISAAKTRKSAVFSSSDQVHVKKNEIIDKKDTDTPKATKTAKLESEDFSRTVKPVREAGVSLKKLGDSQNIVPNKIQPEGLVAPPESEKRKDKKVDCSATEIKAEVEVTRSCTQNPSGKIRVLKNSINGGTGPYQVSIDNSENYYSRYLFENLYSALYAVFIKDNNNCSSKLGEYFVEHDDCTYSYIFAPDEGEVWEIPTKDKRGEIKIFNKSGKLVYQQVFDIEGKYKWYGRNGAGEKLPMGAYLFILKLEQEEPLAGNLTIIR